MQTPTNILFVCLGNICRSPTAEAVMRELAMRQQKPVNVDSAGTAGWHTGQPPDERSTEAALRCGYDMRNLRARQVTKADFIQFDYVLAMDRQNLLDLLDIFDGEGTKPRLLLDFAPDIIESEVPDPYYGGEHGFPRALQMIEQACDGLLTTL